MRRRRLTATLVGVALIPLSALAVAACGGGAATASRPASTSTPTAKTSSVASATVRRGQRPRVDPGRLSRQDPVPVAADTGLEEHCSGACAAAWPPLLTTGADRWQRREVSCSAPPSARTTEQVTYNQHPLYLFTETRVRPDHRTRLRRLRRAVVRALARWRPDYRFGVHEWSERRVVRSSWKRSSPEACPTKALFPPMQDGQLTAENLSLEVGAMSFVYRRFGNEQTAAPGAGDAPALPGEPRQLGPGARRPSRAGSRGHPRRQPRSWWLNGRRPRERHHHGSRRARVHRRARVGADRSAGVLTRRLRRPRARAPAPATRPSPRARRHGTARWPGPAPLERRRVRTRDTRRAHRRRTCSGCSSPTPSRVAPRAWSR